jgi:hypothetical protein
LPACQYRWKYLKYNRFQNFFLEVLGHIRITTEENVVNVWVESNVSGASLFSAHLSSVLCGV